jgi:hypothetical protein
MAHKLFVDLLVGAQERGVRLVRPAVRRRLGWTGRQRCKWNDWWTSDGEERGIVSAFDHGFVVLR